MFWNILKKTEALWQYDYVEIFSNHMKNKESWKRNMVENYLEWQLFHIPSLTKK